jgi:glucose-1-phosphate thymidylyltransferase
MMISCPEEIALRMGYIDKSQFLRLAEGLKGNQYGDYLFRISEEI